MGEYYLHRVNLKIEIFVLYQAIYAFCKNTLEVALAGTATGIGGHHPRHRGIGTQERSEFCCCFELGRQYGLEHREKEVLLSAFVLVTIQSEHDGLEQSIDFGERDKTA